MTLTCDHVSDFLLRYFALKVLWSMVNRVWPPKKPAQLKTKKVNKKDYDVLAYIAGWLIRKAKQYYFKMKKWEERRLVDLFSCEPGEAAKDFSNIVKVKDRGGLTYVTQSTVELFAKMEAFFREKHANTTSYSEKDFIDEGVALIENDFLFCVNESGEGGSFSPETLVSVTKYFLKKFFRTRAHHRCKTLVEPVKRKSKKGLRKSLKTKSESRKRKAEGL